MLRIQRNDVVAHAAVLELHGLILGEWADLLESECVEALRSGAGVVLDLSGVAFIGQSGIDVLRRLRASGVRIIECPPLLAAVLAHEGIEVDRGRGDVLNGARGMQGDPESRQ